MIVRITNFKSIDDLEIELAPLTLLLGPPASGKSNILDALALAGYMNRLVVLEDEYGNDLTKLEPPPLILRFNKYEQLFRYNDLSRSIVIEVDGILYNIYFGKGTLHITINNTDIQWNLKIPYISPSSFLLQGIKESISRALGETPPIESRLYGYDRYGLASPVCNKASTCGFYAYLKKQHEYPFPRNILSELGWNAPTLITSAPDIVRELNYSIAERLGERIEIKVLRSGAIAIFDYDYEVDAYAVSDTVFRILYYLLALRSASNYIKIHGFEKRFIIMLEEPEAHIFPFFIPLLVKYIEKTMKLAYIVITTHNPLLLSALWDQITVLKTYYVYRDPIGSTRALEINIEKLAEELVGSEELLLMSPREVLGKFVIQKSHTHIMQ